MRSNGRAFKPIHLLVRVRTWESFVSFHFTNHSSLFPYSLAEAKISTGAVLQLGADVVSDMSGLAVASQMNLYRRDH